jgi:hypothetical protein
VLLLGDQFEELFTLCPDAEQRNFLDSLLRAASTSAASRQLPNSSRS